LTQSVSVEIGFGRGGCGSGAMSSLASARLW
jgi:hypothetical protein